MTLTPDRLREIMDARPGWRYDPSLACYIRRHDHWCFGVELIGGAKCMGLIDGRLAHPLWDASPETEAELVAWLGKVDEWIGGK